MRRSPPRKLGACSSSRRRPSRSRPRRRCPAATSRCRSPSGTRCSARRSQPPFPDGMEQRVFGMGCFWGAERMFWQAAGVYTTAVGYAGGYTPNPTYEEVCSGRTGHTEVVLVVFDPAVDPLRGAPAPLLGEPRPDAGHAPGQRRRHAVPLGDLLGERRAARRRRGVARHLPGRARARRLRRDHDRDRRGRPVLLRRGYHQQYLAKNPNGYCGLGGTGVVLSRLGSPPRSAVAGVRRLPGARSGRRS